MIKKIGGRATLPRTPPPRTHRHISSNGGHIMVRFKLFLRFLSLLEPLAIKRASIPAFREAFGIEYTEVGG